MISIVFWPIFLLSVAIAFVFLELFIPSGGALGFLAAIAVIASVYVAFSGGGSVFGTIWFAVSITIFPLAIAVALRWWPHTRFGQRVFNLPSEPKKDEVAQVLKSLIGRQGVSKTVMLPAGDIQVDDQIFDAVSEGMPIEAGQRIVVTRVEGNRILVRPDTSDTRGPTKKKENDILSRPIESLGLEGFDEPLT